MNPCRNLDAKLRVQVRRELRELQRQQSLTTIFVTQHQEEAKEHHTATDWGPGEEVIQQVGAPMELYQRPQNLFVANFLGTANILDGHVLADGTSRTFDLTGGIRLRIPAFCKCSGQR